jgi:hypothetical protein
MPIWAELENHHDNSFLYIPLIIDECIVFLLVPMISYPKILDENESWWVCGVDEMFGSSMTSATSSVLQTELDNCQELLQMEPNNKCELIKLMYRTSLIMVACACGRIPAQDARYVNEMNGEEKKYICWEWGGGVAVGLHVIITLRGVG